MAVVLGVGEGLKTLNLLCQVRKGGRHACFKLRCSFRVVALPKFMFASGNEERLLGTEATLLDCGSNLVP